MRKIGMALGALVVLLVCMSGCPGECKTSADCGDNEICQASAMGNYCIKKQQAAPPGTFPKGTVCGQECSCGSVCNGCISAKYGACNASACKTCTDTCSACLDKKGL
jgi:hypothetical protein